MRSTLEFPEETGIQAGSDCSYLNILLRELGSEEMAKAITRQDSQILS